MCANICVYVHVSVPTGALPLQGVPSFSSSPAADLQPLFDVDPPWLGADVATSLPLGGITGSYLWLHGDTLYGHMFGGSRVVTAMPRNSVAVLNVSANGEGD